MIASNGDNIGDGFKGDIGMIKKQYKIMVDNLGEYSVLRPDGSIVSTEIKNKAEAELFCDELNNLLKENIELQGKASSWKITASEEIFEQGELIKQISEVKKENEELKQFKENVINWVDSQMKFNSKKYIETEDYYFKSENIDLHNFKVYIGID